MVLVKRIEIQMLMITSIYYKIMKSKTFPSKWVRMGGYGQPLEPTSTKKADLMFAGV